jgi:hypothetical protein
VKYLKSYKLFETLETEMNFDKIVEILSTECSDFLDLLEKWKIKGVFRGVSSAYLSDPIVDGLWKKITQKNREPRDINPVINKKLNDEFIKKFGIPIRSSGVFATKDVSIATDYGNHPFFNGRQESFLFFPKNGFRYFWNPQINDLFTELRDNTSFYNKDPFFWNSSEKMDFQKIIDGYKEGEIEKVKWHELTFICDEYYLVDLDYYDKFLDYFVN